MPIRRKYEGWRLEPRHKWEDENRIVVTEIGKVSESEKQSIAACIRKLLDEFGLPVELEVVAGGHNLTRSMQEMLKGSLSLDRLDTDFVLDELNKKRKEDVSLRPAIILKVNPYEYKLADPEAKYGVGYEDGLVILRFAHEEAVTHEMGHMLGMSSHCDKPDCVMRYECPSKNFCEDCKARLKGLWCYTEPK